MKNIELKNCPNCDNRIGIHDIECPYCKYIDDPKYKKYNDKLLKKNKRRRNKKMLYKLLLLIPFFAYLFYLLIDIKSFVIILPLVLLNVMSLFTKKDWVFGILCIEIIVLFFRFIENVKGNLISELLVLIFGVVLLIVPKIIYLIKNKKKKRKKK